MQGRKSIRNMVGGCVLLVTAAGLALHFSRPAPMNVILITLDTTRADRMGCYGYANARTPALDSLAKAGVLFERAYAPVPVTLPSHASILTGLYPPEHGLHYNGRGRLADDVPVLAQILRKANYDTGAFVASYVLHAKFGLDRGFQTYDDTPPDKKSVDDHFQQFRNGRSVIDAALNWLQSHSSGPFFCWVHLYDAHAPYNARPELFGDDFAEQPYDAGIAFADSQMERLCEFVRDQRLGERTLIVVVGDHGEGLMEHDEEEHGYQLYNTTLQVPLVIVDPHSGRAGRRVSTAVSLVDVMPTILDCLSIPKLAAVTGRSIKAALTGNEIDSRPIYAETDVPYLYSRWAPLRTIVNERWKYIKTTRVELYDLQSDPMEMHDLAANDPDRCHELENVLHELVVSMKPRESTSVALTIAERKVLESLGYVSGKRSSPRQPSRHQPDPQLPDVKDMLPWFNRIEESKHLLVNGDSTQAIQILRDVLEKVPGYLAARMALGEALRDQKNYAEAAKVFASVVALQPDFTEAYASWADVLAGQRMFEEAIPRYHKALEMDSQSAGLHFSLANALTNLGRNGEAISELKMATQFSPDFVDAHVQLGGLFAQSGLMKSAISQFEVALKYQPRLVIAHANLGSLFAQQGNFEKAVFHASRAVEIDPESYEARFTLGAVLMEKKAYQRAIDEFTEACRIRPDDQAALQQLEVAKTKLNAKPR